MADPYPMYPEVEPAAANAPYCGGQRSRLHCLLHRCDHHPLQADEDHQPQGARPVHGR